MTRGSIRGWVFCYCDPPIPGVGKFSKLRDIRDIRDMGDTYENSISSLEMVVRLAAVETLTLGVLGASLMEGSG
jgi:hypothetical protein